MEKDARMIKLIDGDKKSFKANLHCHSTMSDGKFTPQELKKLYKDKGYSVLAITDHEVLFMHDDLNDKDFLTLPSYEVQIYGDLDLPKLMRRVTHMNFYAKVPKKLKQPFFNYELVSQLDIPPDTSNVECLGDGKQKHVYSAEGLNELIKKANDAGFIVAYNHPTWSKEDASIYTNLKGLFAMEIFNTEVQVDGYDAYCPYIYEEMIRSGQKIGCIATDDLHVEEALFGGFTMINADSLDHLQIISALEKGDYYASTGPIIKELSYKDGTFYIECSPVKEIIISNSGRRKKIKSIKTAKDGLISSAQFALDDMDICVRFTIRDENGKVANTRAYWREEFESSKPSIPNICNRKISNR